MHQLEYVLENKNMKHKERFQQIAESNLENKIQLS